MKNKIKLYITLLLENISREEGISIDDLRKLKIIIIDGQYTLEKIKKNKK